MSNDNHLNYHIDMSREGYTYTDMRLGTFFSIFQQVSSSQPQPLESRFRMFISTRIADKLPFWALDAGAGQGSLMRQLAKEYPQGNFQNVSLVDMRK